MDPRTRTLLEAPIATTLLRLAAPNMLVMVVQAAVGLVDEFRWALPVRPGDASVSLGTAMKGRAL
jgi:Na+-driven multidrug efflux pump